MAGKTLVGRPDFGKRLLPPRRRRNPTTPHIGPHGHWRTSCTRRTVLASCVAVGGLKAALEKTFKVSNDPQFEEKLCDVVGLYLNPPDNAVVFCIDEKTSIQALDRTQPGLPLKKGRCGTITHDYKRNGTRTLFAALEVATGSVTGACYQKHTHKEFLTFLKTVEGQTDKEKDLHVIVDNYATHKHPKVRNWLKRNPRVVLHFTPTSASWLNLVERFFGILTEKQLKRGVFTSVAELEQADSWVY